MAAAVNTIANGGVRVSPSLIQGSATTNAGQVVGTDHTTTAPGRQRQRRPPDDDDDGAGRRPRTSASRPAAQVPGYVVAGKTGTAQRVGADLQLLQRPVHACSFAGFAPADNPRFTIYVVVQNPRNGGGGGSVGRPGVLQDHGVRPASLRRAPTGAKPSHDPDHVVSSRPLDASDR